MRRGRESLGVGGGKAWEEGNGEPWSRGRVGCLSCSCNTQLFMLNCFSIKQVKTKSSFEARHL